MGHSTLQPDGTIFPLLRDIVSEGAEDLTKAFTANPKATQELIYVIENFVYNMTDIMVSGHYFMSIAKNSLKSIKTRYIYADFEYIRSCFLSWHGKAT